LLRIRTFYAKFDDLLVALQAGLNLVQHGVNLLQLRLALVVQHIVEDGALSQCLLRRGGRAALLGAAVLALAVAHPA
jgi:hypothetical protein